MERMRSDSLRGTEPLRGCGDKSQRGQTEMSEVWKDAEVRSDWQEEVKVD